MNSVQNGERELRIMAGGVPESTGTDAEKRVLLVSAATFRHHSPRPILLLYCRSGLGL